MSKKIGFLLFDGPNGQDVTTVKGLARAALKRGLKVDIFIMHDAVLNSIDNDFEKLADEGANIVACGHNANELEAKKSDKFTYGSQYDNAKIVNEVDKYIAFT